jgi:hypothetical protein
VLNVLGQVPHDRGKRTGISDYHDYSGVLVQAQQFEAERLRARVPDRVADQLGCHGLDILGVVLEIVIAQRGPDVEARSLRRRPREVGAFPQLLNAVPDHLVVFEP